VVFILPVVIFPQSTDGDNLECLTRAVV
jgi:hypothetical protein